MHLLHLGAEVNGKTFFFYWLVGETEIRIRGVAISKEISVQKKTAKQIS